MTTPNKHCTVRLDRGKYDRLVALASARGCTPSDLLRAAVENFLASDHLLSASQRRIARNSEFQQLALDIIIREQFPEYRDRIIAETDKRLEQYHGA
ncbi:hypothetical protein [Sphingobium sp.]|uniref:hypothetical protein n=1 Tax=Sphingobium sp. TaxID=1912891 RepID=UPI002E1B6689